MPFCAACECNVEGSSDSTCNDDGQCTCKDEIEGANCDKCKDGYFDFPNCKGILKIFFHFSIVCKI